MTELFKQCPECWTRKNDSPYGRHPKIYYVPMDMTMAVRIVQSMQTIAIAAQVMENPRSAIEAAGREAIVLLTKPESA